MTAEDINSFRCGSAHILFDGFSLTKKAGAALPQHQSGGPQGNFTLHPVNLSFSGNRRCYGWYSSNPYVWSAPRDTLELVVIVGAPPLRGSSWPFRALALGATQRDA